MHILPLENGDLVLYEAPKSIHILLCMLEETCSGPSLSSDVLSRLYPDPVKGMDGDEGAEAIRSDWREFVEPEMRKENKSALEKVMADLEKAHLIEPEEVEDEETDPLEGRSDHFSIRIPADNQECWAHVLTQARVILTEEFQLEESMNVEDLAPTADRMLASQQAELYGLLLEMIVERLSEAL